MTLSSRFFRFLLASTLALSVAAFITLVAAYFYIAPQLPPIERLKDVQLQVPLRVYARSGELMAEFGEQHREPVSYGDLPQAMIDAILATEDDRFFQHPGVDYQGLIRAVVKLIITGEKRQGGSTITMQVARNFFLSREKTYLRKVTEIFLALKIERYLTKEEILELYLNKIYFGHRAYGIGAAARVYYGADINQLTIPQIAMIAGLPKAPSANNPVSNPKRALQRRNYVLGRMYSLGFLDTDTYRESLNEPDDASLHKASIELEASWVAEMVRSHMRETYGDEAYTAGYNVYTTIDATRQQAANAAVLKNLLDYDQRHGYRGVVRHIELPEEFDEELLIGELKNVRPYGGLSPALVVAIEEQIVRLNLRDGSPAEIDLEGLTWARRYITVNQRGPKIKTVEEVLKRGDIVYIQALPEGRWQLAQLPNVTGALVSVRPQDGAIQALVGGFDFYFSKFNRAVQAQRQPGSSFKPFIYSAALNKGYTVASLFNDAPVVFDDPSLETTWRPENYSGKFYGPTRMREALTRSRNLVSIRLLRAIGARYASRYVQRFGFRQDQVPKDLSLALGSGTATPLEMARAYSVWANGGFYTEPYFIEEIRSANNEVLFRANPAIACDDCEAESDEAGLDENTDVADAPLEVVEEVVEEKSTTQSSEIELIEEEILEPVYAERVVDAANVYLMSSMMRGVVRRGTGRRAMALGRKDLAGKTGTTNDQRDAWFCGFNAQLVTTVWVGYDRVQPLGNGETGSRAALPMWVGYMGEALKGMPESVLPQPPGLVSIRIDPETGLRMPPGRSGGIFEIFRPEYAPSQYSQPETSGESGESTDTTIEPLF
ncbi:Multimodular transpeptidase-transglycosylase [hydrothermal vent metagenome]|uniref:Penicillin-binding protein 1A n=1 Tax=hydrothermal vent metagenome TaxID=652676 RepID=A0A3B0ZEC0_9ZZZZ